MDFEKRFLKFRLEGEFIIDPKKVNEWMESLVQKAHDGIPEDELYQEYNIHEV